MYALIIVIHIIACIILITAILFQSGRGGGLSDLFGTGASQTIFGARASTFLTRATTVAAIAFLLTCISLTVFSSRRVKSLMSGVKESRVAEEAKKEMPVEIEEEKPQASERQPKELQ